MSEITMETMQVRLKEIIEANEYPNEDGGIEMYLDYTNSLSNMTLHEIMTAENPREHFNNLMNEWNIDGSLYYEDELESKIKEELSDDEKEFFEENEYEFRDWFHENYYFYYDKNHYNETVQVNIMLDTGNANSDFTRDNILNYCSYYSNGGKDLKDSSILWLAKQQKKAGLLRKAIKQQYRDDKYYVDREKESDKFIESCIQELENLSSHMGTLTFLVNMRLFDYFELREAMETEKKLNDSYIFEERKGKGSITISKDTMCGLFDVWSGGGSVLEIELDKDVILPIKCIWRAEIETGKSEYGHSVDSVYGLVGSAWDGTVKETHYMNEEQIEKIAIENEVK